MKPEYVITLISALKKVLSELFFNGREPEWLALAFKYFVLLVLLLLGIYGLLQIISQIIKIWAEQIRPLYYDQAQRKRLRRRQRFANHIEQEIRQLNSREEWKDYRFTELEAEVEAEGKRLRFQLLPFFRSTRRGLRREESLSKALELSGERLILLAGDPGSGKSIALRHVAEKLALRSSKDKKMESIIPLYVNLKKLERPAEAAINRDLIESFVKQEINRINDRDVEQFIEAEFQNGITAGTWLFLFDSFDELPEVLSSVETDKTIADYAQAIDDFLNGFNQCRGIIASRQFRGPKHLGWPIFRILPLDSRRWELIHKADLDPRIERYLGVRLRVASQEIQEMTKNPMFLGILCEIMRAGSDFPNTTHSVFENYLETRLCRDAERLQRRFQLQPAEVRLAAERIAFCMSIDSDLGLSPTRAKIRAAMDRQQLDLGGDIENYMNALEYLKLARSEAQSVPGDPEFFTFSHRRFQEYFATCIVLRDLKRISPRLLLTDGRWRETAVVILQTQSAKEFDPILIEASKLLHDMTVSIPDLIEEPYNYIEHEENSDALSALKPFAWPPGLLPLLALLQDGLMGRTDELPAEIQDNISRILLTASTRGSLADQKWSLEVSGITSPPILLWLLRRAFVSDSQWLKDIAYLQTAQLGKIPDDIAADIYKSLSYLFSKNRLNKEYHATYAHLSRLDEPSRFINSLRLLRWIPTVDNLLIVGVSIGLIMIGSALPGALLASLFTAMLLFIVIKIVSRTVKSKMNYAPISMFFLWFSEGVTMGTRLILFPLLWAPFAIIASEQGLFTSLIWWPFLGLFPILCMAFYFKRTRRFVNQSLPMILGTSSFAALMLILFLVLSIRLSPVKGLLIFFFGMFIFLCALSGPSAYFQLRDQLRFQKWQRVPVKQLTAQQMLHLLSLYQSAEFSKILIATIREKNALIPTEESENSIKYLALALESTIEDRLSDKNAMASEFLLRWIEKYNQKDNQRLRKLGAEFLDEIYLLLEQVHFRRKVF